ncbi:MAG: hypothetical protein FJ336_07610 [Sphingomonadales bacterium]|nr:hypothetical protein [Sphingomonadales bacterium]
MPIYTPGDAEHLRAEIAAAAARMIAEDGADYASAKRKAAKLIIGHQKIRGDVLPDNAQVEAHVREYQALFLGDSQPQRLQLLRLIALEWMEKLADFSPWLVGAVLNGTAGEHSDIHLRLFTENTKDVAVYLLNTNINYEVSESSHFRYPDRQVETLSFMWKHEGIHLSLYDRDGLRGASRKFGDRADLAGLRALLAEGSQT